MKIYSTVFALFLVSFTLSSTHTWAQTPYRQPNPEPMASQDARWLGEEIQRNQPVVSEALKADLRSRDAMHWTTVSVHPQNKSLLADTKQSLENRKATPTRISITQPAKTAERPIHPSL